LLAVRGISVRASLTPTCALRGRASARLGGALGGGARSRRYLTE
jgi:hypothetical protein